VTRLEELERLSEIYKALGNKPRLAVLIELNGEGDVSGLTDDLDITRSGLQRNIETLIDAELVYRPVDVNKTYALTALGEYFVQQIEADAGEALDLLDEFEERYEDLEERESERFEVLEESDLDTSELENKLKAETWEEIEESG
jgi:predicted transcriptional regulator